jgi:hypothetical protein
MAMRLENIKAVICVGWVVVTCAGGSMVGIDTASGWALFAAVVCLPPLALWLLWNDPRQTLSESIDQARR